MIKIHIQKSIKELLQLTARPSLEKSGLQSVVNEIFSSVREKGDEQLLALTNLYDKADIKSILVSKDSVDRAYDQLDDELKQAILTAKENISKFHKAQMASTVEVETMPGVYCYQKSIPLERVGIYIPGGTAPLFSTILMLAVPAQIAGVKDIILCSPPTYEGGIHPVILATAKICGITHICQVGGAQAVAAMSIGTPSVPKVTKIFGPGNQYVTAAKEYAQQFGVAIDMPAGPSEVLVYADETCYPSYVAADLLSQAEHGTDSQVIAVVSSENVASEINRNLAKQIEELPRKSIALKALENSHIIVEPNVALAFDYINAYAPEHFIIASEYADALSKNTVNAGSVFLGNHCPEAAGDYASGTNHTLPTYGWAKSYSGVNIDTFMKKVTFQKITPNGLQNLGPIVIKMAEAEQLQAHANAVKIRLNEVNQ